MLIQIHAIAFLLLLEPKHFQRDSVSCLILRYFYGNIKFCDEF